jgi:hypothetical protein
MYNLKLKYLFLFCILGSFLLSSCGGGTLGSSTSGGVTIKGQARLSEDGAPISNSSMNVLDTRGEEVIIKSETDALGMFEMTLPKSDQSVLIDIEKATSGVVVDRKLLESDEVDLSILDRKGVRTDIEYYLGVRLEAIGECRLSKDPVTSRLSIFLKDSDSNCRIKIRSVFGGATNQEVAKVFQCQKFIQELSNDNNQEVNINLNSNICEQNKIEIKFETLNIEILVILSSN